MRFGIALLAAVATQSSCQRSEEPRSSVAPAVTSAAPSSTPDPTPPPPPAPPPPQTPPCVAPLTEEPPPPARPAASCPEAPTPPPLLGRGRVVFSDAPGAPAAEVEIARTPAEQARGLMYRTSLKPDLGMLFPYPAERKLTFWMHNTCIPLDMLFIGMQGSIVGILEQVPTLNEQARGVPCPAAYVLELNAGWSRRHGVKPGMQVRFE